MPFCPYVNEDLQYLLGKSPVGKTLIGVLGVELLGHIIETSSTKKCQKILFLLISLYNCSNLKPEKKLCDSL